jgi:hypothetical protein
MRTLISRALLAATVSLALAAACGYDPTFEDGTLKCGSSNTCPDGYSCRSGLCGANGTGGSGANNAKFVGHWVFNAAATSRTRVCSDGTNETTTPWDDFFDVVIGPVTALSTEYYCTWNLDVNGSGTATTIRSGSMCTKPDPTIPGTSYTWHGESFTLTTTNGTSGMLEASLPYEYITALGNGSCTMHFTGPVTKQ